MTLIKGGVYDDLSLTVGEALKKRSPVSLHLKFSLCQDYPPADLFFPPGLSRNLHMLVERWAGHHLRHHPQVSRAPTGRGRRQFPAEGRPHTQRHPGIHSPRG